MSDETLAELLHVVRGDFGILEEQGNIILQRYDESWSEWLDITEAAELKDRAKIKVVLLPSKEDANERTRPPIEEPKKGTGTFLMFLFIYQQMSEPNGHVLHSTFFVYLYFSGMFNHLILN